MKYTTISIIIPVYNVEIYLRKCLDSIVNQTYSQLQIIIVNDGSPDNSHLIIDEFQKSDSRIQVVNQRNAGLSAARNAGLKVATGDYIMFVDSDDWIEFDMCEVMLNAAISHDTDVVMCSYIREFENISLPRINFPTTTYFDESTFPFLYKRMIGLTGHELKQPETLDSLSTACLKLYRAGLIKSRNVIFEDTKLIGTEDLLFNARILRFAKSGVGLPHCFYHYRKTNKWSLTQTYKPKLFDQWYELHNRLYVVINEMPHTMEAFYNRIALSVIGLGLNEINSNKNPIEIIRGFEKILSSERYRHAFCNLTLKYFPLHWKIFFFTAKYKLSPLLYILLFIINKLIGHR